MFICLSFYMYISRQMIALYLEIQVGFQCWKSKYLNLHLLATKFNHKFEVYCSWSTVECIKAPTFLYLFLINTFTWHFWIIFPGFVCLFLNSLSWKKTALKYIIEEQIELFNKWGNYISPFHMLGVINDLKFVSAFVSKDLTKHRSSMYIGN